MMRAPDSVGCASQINLGRVGQVLRMRVPIPDEVKPAREAFVDLTLLRPSVWLIARPASPVRSARSGGFNHLDHIVFEAGEELAAGFALPPPDLLALLESREHVVRKDEVLSRRADRIGDH